VYNFNYGGCSEKGKRSQVKKIFFIFPQQAANDDKKERRYKKKFSTKEGKTHPY
jgi:hypothetical protein